MIGTSFINKYIPKGIITTNIPNISHIAKVRNSLNCFLETLSIKTYIEKINHIPIILALVKKTAARVTPTIIISNLLTVFPNKYFK